MMTNIYLSVKHPFGTYSRKKLWLVFIFKTALNKTPSNNILIFEERLPFAHRWIIFKITGQFTFDKKLARHKPSISNTDTGKIKISLS